MSGGYSDDAVLSKLSALNETHDSISAAAQWLMFHRRMADRTAQLWFQKLKDSNSAKRLNLVYLANEVAQQTKARHKEEFLIAFSPILAEAAATAYKGAPSDLQAKLRKVVSVWRDRHIFEEPIQAAVEARIEELESARSGQSGASIFGTSSSSSVPPEMKTLVAPQQAVSALVLTTQKAVSEANQDYEKATDAAAPAPKPPVLAARLNGLLKKLAKAEGAVQDSVNARTQLVGALEKMLGDNRAALIAEQDKLDDFKARKSAIDAQKNEVEHSIMTGLASNEKDASQGDTSIPAPEPDRPEMEALTPPPTTDEPEVRDDGPVMAHVPAMDTFQPSPAPGIEMLSHLALQYQAVPVSTNGANKKRKIEAGDDFPDLGNDDGIDADTLTLLRNDSRGA